MELSLQALAQQVSLQGAIATVLVFGFVATLLRSLFTKDPARFHKFCGALAIFLLAVKVDNEYFYVLSVLVGGLVVASENFMLRLVSLLWARRENVVEIVREIFKTADQVAEPVKTEAIAQVVTQEPKVGEDDVPKKS